MIALLNNNIALAIYLALKNKTYAEQSLISQKIIQFLARKRLLSEAPNILSRLNKIINEDQNKILAKVSSKEILSQNKRKELIHSLSKHYEGKIIILEESLNEKLIGGFKIEINDEIIDFSIKNRIKKLQEHLISNA